VLVLQPSVAQGRYQVFSLFWPEQAQSTVAWTKLQATWIRQHPAKTPIEPFRWVDFDAINYIRREASDYA
jgi:hypothetical protein